MNSCFLRSAVAFTLVCALALVGLAASARASAQGPAPGDLAVSVDMTDVATHLGDTFQFTSTITNNGTAASGTLIANLDFVALDGKTYVDPEDWSSERTVELGSIAANATAQHTWTVKSVVNGDVGVYVAVLPQSPQLASSVPAAASPVIHIHVQERRPINPGGILPVAVAVPTAVALVFAGLRAIRRRR